MSAETNLRNRILYVLALHGVDTATAESIWTTLLTGDDPMPEHLPAQFEFLGHTLTYPRGNGRRVLHEDERKAFNNAIIAANGHDTLDRDATASEARLAFEHMLAIARNDRGLDNPFKYKGVKACGYTSPTGLKCQRDHGHDNTLKHKNHRTTWGDRPATQNAAA